jgi:cytosine/adenosine deaminase-related metal-dependent hydrolase
MPPWTLTAHWLFPVDRPPLERGTITLDGDKILAVEPHGSCADVDLGEVAVLPGLVNVHTHLDLSGLRGLAPPTPNFTGWLRRVIAHRRSRAPEQVQTDIQTGLSESLRFGTTLLGDISGDGSSWEMLARAPLRAVVFRELLGLPAERASRAWAEVDAWLATCTPTSTCRPGVSPHAPYSVHSSLFLAASTMTVPAAVHLAESAAELQLLLDRQGPFVPFLRELGVWEPLGLAEDADHVLRLCRGLAPVLFIHGNYLSPDALIPPNGTLVYCPRTHAAFGHPPHPFQAFLARGHRVALGTDSLASNPDLDVLAEARFLHQIAPNVPGATLVRMITLAGAEALGWEKETGSLTPGKSADLVVLPLPGARLADPHELILASAQPVQAILFRGRWVQGGAVPGGERASPQGS